MRKKNGFISMSIIYSFFTVFILVSTSLLLIYSNNLAIVKSVNKEIKENLTTKGNNNLMVFKNLITDGSFEDYSHNWIYSTDTDCKAPIYTQQRYYGDYSLGMVKESEAQTKTLVQSSKTFYMYKDHIYYISRIYLSFRGVEGGSLILKIIPSGSTNFDVNAAGNFNVMSNAFGIMQSDALHPCNDISNTDACKFGNRSINQERFRFQSGFCLGVNGRCSAATSGANAANTSANTYESGIFKFNKNSGDYKLLIGTNFSSYDTSGGVLPRYYTDGYMLFDLTEALKLDGTKTNKLFNNGGIPNGYRVGAGKIDNLLDGRYIEDQKTIPVNELGL